jgi:hypothetical protein
MNVYQKLNEARDVFHQQKLKKSGHNQFANYRYFELGDFTIPAMRIFKDVGLLSLISFDKEFASMTIVNTENPEEKIVFTSPMSNAAMKGNQEVQNLGAVQTYLRRYLWVSALEIVEHDELDAVKDKPKKGDAPIITPRGDTKIDDDRMSVIVDVQQAIYERFEVDDIIGAFEEYSGITDPDEKTVLWDMLNSKVRSSIKKYGESLKEGS